VRLVEDWSQLACPHFSDEARNLSILLVVYRIHSTSGATTRAVRVSGSPSEILSNSCKGGYC